MTKDPLYIFRSGIARSKKCGFVDFKTEMPNGKTEKSFTPLSYNKPLSSNQNGCCRQYNKEAKAELIRMGSAFIIYKSITVQKDNVTNQLSIKYKIVTAIYLVS